MSNENPSPRVIRETSSNPTPIVAIGNSAASNKRVKPQVKENLSFLRYENLLSPSEPHYIPPTVDQINSLAQWAGISGGGKSGKGDLADVANVEEFLVKKWTNQNKRIEESNVINGCVWRYLLIRLGVIEQPSYRRAEPSTVIRETYDIDGEPLTLRAQIWYNRQDTVTIDLFNDSLHSESRRDSKPIFSLELEHDASLTSGNTIQGYLRHDDFKPENDERFAIAITGAIEKRRITKKELNYYVTFFKGVVWKGLWAIHDFNSINPKDFLKCINKDPFTLSHEQLPTHRDLLSLCNWAGIKKAELAYICGETPKRMNWLASGKGEAKVKEAVAQFNNNEITSNQLQGKRWANVISRHAVAMIMSAFGLAPQIPVIGRKEPQARKTRTFVLKEVAGVPVEFIKIETTFMFTNALRSEVKVLGKVVSHKGAGEEWSETYHVEASEDLDIRIDGHLYERGGEPSESWERITAHVPELAHSYINKALWNTLRNYLLFHFTK